MIYFITTPIVRTTLISQLSFFGISGLAYLLTPFTGSVFCLVLHINSIIQLLVCADVCFRTRFSEGPRYFAALFAISAGLFSELIFTSEDSISMIGIPERIILDADNFSGRLEYQIIKTSL